MAGAAAFIRKKPVSRIIDVDISEIRFNNQSVSLNTESAEIHALAESIAQNGILQPLQVHLIGGNYELIKGIHILHAAICAGLHSVPCIVSDMNCSAGDIKDLLDEIHMQKLNFFQEAEAIEKLISLYGITQEEAAAQLGRAQSTIANKLRLLRLTESERDLIIQHRLTERHARAILRIGAPEERLIVLNQVIKQNLNVEKTEKAVEMRLGRRRKREPYRKRSRSIQNIHSFVKTVNKAAETMQAAGIGVQIQQIQKEGWVEFQIRIPQKKYTETEADIIRC